MRYLPSLIRLVVCFACVFGATGSAAAQPLTITTGSNLGTQPVGPFQQPLTAQGGEPPYVWSLGAGPQPPAGFAIRADVPPWFPPGSAALSGVSIAPGPYSFTLTVTDSAQPVPNTDSRTFDLVITNLRVADSGQLPDAFVNVAYDYLFTAVGGAGAVTFAEDANSPPPAGLAITADGHLTGSPQTGGFFGFNVVVTDGVDTVYRWVNLSVHHVRITSSGTLPVGQSGQEYSETLTATGGTGSIEWSSFGMPFGFSLDAASGEVSSDSAPPGIYFFTAVATDDFGNSYSRRFMVVVMSGFPGLPELQGSIPQEDFTIGEPRATSFWVNGGTPPYSWSAQNLPAGLTLRFGDAAGPNSWPNQVELSGTAVSLAPITFEISVTDSSPTPITVTRSFTLGVSRLAFDVSNMNWTLNQSSSGGVRVYGGSRPYESVRIGGSLPTGVAFDGSSSPAGPTVSGVPLEWGGYGPLLDITDDQDHRLTRSFGFFVNGPGSNVNIGTGNELPDATVNQPYLFSLWSCCAPDVTWAVETGSTLPAGLILDTDTGQLSGQPTGNGDYTFRIRATDAANAADFVIREFALLVTPIQITTFGLPYGNDGTSYSQTLTAVGGENLTWELGPHSALPPGLTLSAQGVLSGTPTTAGRFSFQAIVSDQSGHSRTGFFSVDFYPPGGAPPVGVAMNGNLGTFTLGQIELALHASGGDGNYVWTVVDPDDLPPGLRIRTDGAPWFPPSADAGLIGVATRPDEYTFDLTVTSAGQSITQTFTMTITSLNALDPHTLPDAFEGEAFSYTFTSNQGASTSWALQQGGFPPPPAWLTMDADGTLHGTPPAGAAGTYQISIVLTDGPDVVHRTFSLLVSAVQIAPAGLFHLTAGGGVVNQIQFIATPAGGPYVWSATGLSGFSTLTMSPDGLLSGTVTRLGTQYVNVTATDTTTGRFYTRRVTLNPISDVPGLPSLNTFTINDWTVGQAQSVVFSASGGKAPYAWSIQNRPSGTELRTTGTSPSVYPEQAELFGVVQTAGTYTFTISMTDSSTPPITVAREYTMHVSELMLTGFAPGPLSFGVPHGPSTVRVIGGDLGYEFAIQSGKVPAGLSLASNGVLSGTPQETGGTFAQLQITDDGGHVLRTGFGLFVQGPGTTLQINNFYELSATQNQPFSFTFSACCVPSYQWQLEPGSVLPAGLALSGAGVLSGTPTAAGQFVFRVRVFDSTPPLGPDFNFAVREFVMTITPLTYGGPTTLPFANVGTSYTHQLAEPTGGSGDVSWSLNVGSALPPGLTLTETTPGVWAIAGTPQYAGQYSFSLKITRGGDTRIVFFQLSIFPAGAGPPLDFPIGLNWSSRVGRITIPLQAMNGQGPYSYSLAPVLPPGSIEIPGMRVQDADEPQPLGTAPGTGTLLGVITEPGSYTTTVRVTDSASAHLDRTLTIVVSPIAITTNFDLPDATSGLPYTRTLSAAGGAGSYLWTLIGALPAGMTLSPQGVLSGVPTTFGTFNFTVTATDGAAMASQGLKITVHPFSIDTGSVLPIATQGSSYSVTLSAPGCTPSCAWTIVNGSLPGGLTLNPSTGAISGTPTNFGTMTPTIQASAGGSMTSRKVFSLFVQSSTPQPIGLPALALQPATIGQQIVSGLFARGGVPPYTWEIIPVEGQQVPPGLALVDGRDVSFNTGWSSPYLAGAPIELGSYRFTIRYTDSVGATADGVFSILISPLSMEYRNLPLPGTVLQYGAAYTQRLLGLGGSGSYAWSAPQGMPPGLQLAMGGADLVDGMPLNTGSFTRSITMTDTGPGADALTQGVTFNIASNTAATLTIANGPNLGVFAQGFVSTVTLNASGGPPVPPRVFTFSLAPGSNLPAGFALVSGDALSSGAQPGATQVLLAPTTTGPFEFTLEVRDQDGNFGAKTLTGIVSPFTIATNASLPDGSETVPYAQPLHAWGAGGTWSLLPGSAPLPPGLSLADSAISGTPTTAGNYSFSLRVCDAALVCVSRNFSLRISTIALTDPPVLSIFSAGQAFSKTLAATGGGASKAFSIVPLPGGNTGLPAGLSLAANGVLSGTTNSLGAFTFTVAATDGVSTVAKTFTIMVGDPNPSLLSPLPTSGSDTRFVTAGQNFSFSPQARGGKPPYAWTIASGDVPGLTLYTGAAVPAGAAPGSAVLAGAPTTVGSHTVYLTATDANGATTTVRLTVNVSPVSLLLQNLRGAIYNEPYAQQLVASGGTGTFTNFALVEETVLPAGLALSSTGLIGGTPTDTGNFNFQVEATDSANNKIRRTYNLNVRQSAVLNGLDLNSGVIADTTVGSGLAFTIRANGTPSTNITWSVKSTSALPAGLVLLSGAALPPGFPAGAALLTGVPTSPGPQEFVLQAADDLGSFGERTFRMHVTPFQIVSFTLLRDATVDTQYTGDPLVVVGGTSLVFAAAPLINNLPPPGLTLNAATGALEGTPTVSGNFVLTVRVTGGGFRLQRNVTINIAAAGAVTPLVLGGNRVFPDASKDAPLAVPLDTRASGGTKPYVWTASGLPAGVSLVPGSAAHSAYLAGRPTAAGPATFTLTVHDSSTPAQELTATYSMNVSSIRLSPEILPTAIVGTAFTPAPLTATGGTAPYTIQSQAGSSLPPNLSRVISGSTVTLSGTPSVQGRFGMGFTVIDSTGATLNRGVTINIDAAGTPTPYVALNPTSVQVSYVQNGPVPPPVPVTISSSSTDLAFTAALGGVPASALSVATGTTPRTTNIVFDGPGLQSLSPGVYHGVLAVSAANAINLSTAIPITLTVAPAPPCEYTLGSTSATASSGHDTGTFSLTTDPVCGWTAVSSAPSWLRVDNNPPNGFGSATIAYSVIEPNLSQTPRSATIAIGGQTFTVTQFGIACSYALGQTALNPPAAGSTDDPVSVLTSKSACTWTASSSASWLEVLPPAGGTGTGAMHLRTLASGDVGPRVGTVTLFDGVGAPVGTITVTQAGIGCAVTLSESGISLPATASNGSVMVTFAPCGFTVVPPPQVTIIPDPDPNLVRFLVSANVSTQPRSLTMYIGGTPFVIEQPGMACDVSVSGSNPVFNASGGAGSLSVGSNVPTCDWSASSQATWVIIDTGHTGAGNGSVTFTVAPNALPTPRSTTLTVAGQDVQINQAGITCTYALRSPTGTVPATGGSGSAGVIAAGACTWSATSNESWLGITSSDNGGTGSVFFIAAGNPSAAPRTGTLTIAGQTYTVTQPGAPCSFTLSSSSATIASIGGGGSLTFSTTTAGCTAPVQSYSSWIDESHSFAGTSGTVTYTVPPNPFGISRVGRILVGDQTFTVTQEGAACAYSLHAPSAIFSAAGGSADLLASGSATGCEPAVGSSPEITLGARTFANNIFTQPYTVAPFSTSVVWVRVLTINFGGVNFAVKQTSW